MKNLRNSFWKRWIHLVSVFLGSTIAYMPFYMWGGLLLWFGLTLLRPSFEFTYWQCFGVAIIFRTIRAWLYHRGDNVSESLLKQQIAQDAWNAALEMVGFPESTNITDKKFNSFYSDYRKELEKV